MEIEGWPNYKKNFLLRMIMSKKFEDIQDKKHYKVWKTVFLPNRKLTISQTVKE